MYLSAYKIIFINLEIKHTQNHVHAYMIIYAF